MKKSNKNTKGIDRKGMPLVKNANGITLIALVVTIVVLLILAGITINMLFSENGIITKAREAAEKTAKAEENDLAGMQNMVDQMNDILNSMNSNGNTLVAMYNEGLSCENPEECTDASHLHIGDYVNYKNPTSGSYTVTAVKSGMTKANVSTLSSDVSQTFTLSETVNNVSWRVLGLDEKTGGLKLIAASPIKRDSNSAIETLTTITNDPYFYMAGAEAYAYGADELDKICAMYKNNLAEEARSATMTDIDEALGLFAETQEEKDTLIKAVDMIGYGNAYDYTDTREINKYTPESYLGISPYTTAKTEVVVSGTVDSYGYVIAKNEEEKTTLEANSMKPVTAASERIYNLLFENVEINLSNGLTAGRPYYLASRGVDAYSDYAYFGPGAVGSNDGMTMACSGAAGNYFDSDGSVDELGLSVRPVVSLKSSVTTKDIQKIADKTETTWNYTQAD